MKNDFSSKRARFPLLIVFSILLNFNFFLLPRICGGEPERILYLLKSGNIASALTLYDDYQKNLGSHNFELMQNMGLAFLELGFQSRVPEIQILTLFGAGISLNENALYILEEGVKSGTPQFQIVAINFLSKCQDDRATEMINWAMSSNYLPIRLEAALHLAKNKNPKASGQIEALMQKVKSDVLSVFPQLLAMCGDRNSINTMRKLLTHPDEKVRIESILATAKYGRDDLLPEIRKLSKHVNAAQQEACAIALGSLKDESSSERLFALAESSVLNVKIAALQALYQLGREEMRIELEKIAIGEDVFAINVLGGMPGCEPTLISLLQSANLNVRINTALSLLKLHKAECLASLPEILIKNRKDFAFAKQQSMGKGLNAWRVVPSAKQNFSDNPAGLEISLRMREEVLTEAIELPEKDFLSLAKLIFDSNQYDLVPVLTQLLVSLQTPDTVKLLKVHREKVGAPLIRNYCNLALYRLREEGPYGAALKQWVNENYTHDLIQFRPLIPLEQRDPGTENYSLTPEEASRLLVESIETLVQSQDEEAISILLNAIRYGNNNNRYALAGLLIRASH